MCNKPQNHNSGKCTNTLELALEFTINCGQFSLLLLFNINKMLHNKFKILFFRLGVPSVPLQLEFQNVLGKYLTILL